MIGDNFTREYKYPIKIYNVGKLEFSNGIEVRKLIASAISIAIMILVFVVLGLKVNPKILSFFLKNWLIILVLVPLGITSIFFSLSFENKGIVRFFKDRILYLFYRNKQYEHFIEVPVKQVENELKFEPFLVKGRDVKNEYDS